jgi:hypothetical protein
MAESNRRWYRFRLRTLLLLILIVAIGMSAYSYWIDYRREQQRRARELPYPAAGDLCTVIFTGDSLGFGPMSPEAATVDGVSNYVRGRFRAIDDQWIVLEGQQASEPAIWIPRDRVLLLKVDAD